MSAPPRGPRSAGGRPGRPGGHIDCLVMLMMLAVFLAVLAFGIDSGLRSSDSHVVAIAWGVAAELVFWTVLAAIAASVAAIARLCLRQIAYRDIFLDAVSTCVAICWCSLVAVGMVYSAYRFMACLL